MLTGQRGSGQGSRTELTQALVLGWRVHHEDLAPHISHNNWEMSPGGHMAAIHASPAQD